MSDYVDNRRPCSDHVWFEEMCEACQALNAPGNPANLVDNGNGHNNLNGSVPTLEELRQYYAESGSPHFYNNLQHLAPLLLDDTFMPRRTDDINRMLGVNAHASGYGNGIASTSSSSGCNASNGPNSNGYMYTFGDFPPSLQHLTVPCMHGSNEIGSSSAAPAPPANGNNDATGSNNVSTAATGCNNDGADACKAVAMAVEEYFGSNNGNNAATGYNNGNNAPTGHNIGINAATGYNNGNNAATGCNNNGNNSATGSNIGINDVARAIAMVGLLYSNNAATGSNNNGSNAATGSGANGNDATGSDYEDVIPEDEAV